MVTRTWGGRFSMAWRRDEGVSPVRTAARMVGEAQPGRPGRLLRAPASGSRRFFSMSFERALSGET